MSIERRPATAAEARALSHPLRLRILRLCLDEALTNRALADRLGQDPATVLHHVRTLVRTGFLAPDAVRRGRRGAREIPYRSTGKSWTLDVGGADDTAAGMVAIHDAVRAEILETGPAGLLGQTRLAVTLDPGRLEELERRLAALIEDLDGWDRGIRVHPDAPPASGSPIAVYLVVHRRPGGGPDGEGSG